jgi:hypothetical protein
MITLFHKTYRNPDKESSPYLPAILLGCAFVLMPLRISAQNAPAGPIAGGTASDQAPAAQTQTPTASSDAHPNLAGTWQLNKKQSDDPREKMQEARNEQGNGGGGGGFGGGGGGRGMGRGRQGQGQGDMMKEFSQLTITQTSSTAKVTGDSGRVLALYSSADQSTNQPASSDSNKSDNSTPNEDSAAAQWQQDQLVVTSQARRGSTTRSYGLSPDGKQLYVTTRIENQRLSQPVVIRFVYDPAKASE